MTSDPLTEAGRKHLDEWWPPKSRGPGGHEWRPYAVKSILAIEAEAVADERERIAPLGELGEAWAEAEAALPEGWDFGITKTEDGRYRASSAPIWATKGAHAEADSPAAALRALAAKLGA